MVFVVDITFQDTVFSQLKGIRAFKMWKMLLSKRTNSTKISYENSTANDKKGSATWTAKYFYGEKQRKVSNIVNANFKFKEGKIIKHIDTFNLWNWSKQVLGTVGFLIGWTPILRNKIQKTTKAQLDFFMNKIKYEKSVKPQT